MAKRKRQTTQWSNEKDRQHNGQTKKTDNTMAKRKRQTTQWPNEKGENDKLQSITHKTKNRGNNRKCWQICFFYLFFIKVVFIHKLFIRKIKHIE